MLFVHKSWRIQYSVFSIQYSLREIICVLAEISAVVLWLMKSVLHKGNEDNMLRIIFLS